MSLVLRIHKNWRTILGCGKVLIFEKDNEGTKLVTNVLLLPSICLHGLSVAHILLQILA